MSRDIKKGTFKLDDLVKVDSSNLVVLASGGPLMTVVATEGHNCLCEWEGDDGTTQRHLFHYWVLRRMILFHPDDLPFPSEDPLGRGGNIEADAAEPAGDAP
jgi:uncharacterized protein YodC (DUF2158 family)